MIENKNVWITGASSGIGSELALNLAQNGNTVVVSARSMDKLTALQAKSIKIQIVSVQVWLESLIRWT